MLFNLYLIFKKIRYLLIHLWAIFYFAKYIYVLHFVFNWAICFHSKFLICKVLIPFLPFIENISLVYSFFTIWLVYSVHYRSFKSVFCECYQSHQSFAYTGWGVLGYRDTLQCVYPYSSWLTCRFFPFWGPYEPQQINTVVA